jgi:hypothetical protein
MSDRERAHMQHSQSPAGIEGVESSPVQVVILMATYNGHLFLRQLLDSVVAQSHQHWTLFVADDGSDDSTMRILDEYGAADDRIVVEQRPRRLGAAQNFLRLLQDHGDGYVMFCDQDDVWDGAKVSNTLRVMLASELEHGAGTPILVHTDLTPVSSDLRPIAHSFSALQRLHPRATSTRRLLIQNTVVGCTVMINHSLTEKALTLAHPERITMHDWWLALVASRFGAITYLGESTILYRLHSANTVGASGAVGIGGLVRRLRIGVGSMRTLGPAKLQAKEFVQSFHPELSEVERQTFLTFAEETHCGLSFHIRTRILKRPLIRNATLAFRD